MKLKFAKYQGTGNDFIIVDNRQKTFAPTPQTVQQLCDRRFGIGADGLILIENHPEHDYRMVYFNADGSQSLCGNGSRCGFDFARSLGIVGTSATFETTDGVHEIKWEDDKIHFQLFDVKEIQQLSDSEWYIDTGSPHHMVISDLEDQSMIVREGRKIRNSEVYSRQNGTNVNFAQLLPHEVKIRTYERGVEDETLSCGTGATAVALMAGKLGYESPVAIRTLGGLLSVSFDIQDGKFTNIWLAGPAEKVFEGTIDI